MPRQGWTPQEREDVHQAPTRDRCHRAIGEATRPQHPPGRPQGSEPSGTLRLFKIKCVFVSPTFEGKGAHAMQRGDGNRVRYHVTLRGQRHLTCETGYVIPDLGVDVRMKGRVSVKALEVGQALQCP